MKPRVGVVQFRAVCPEGNEHPLACGITYEIARRMTTIGGIDASAILPGAGPGSFTLAEGNDAIAGDVAFFAEKTAGISVPSLGAQYESDFLVIGKVQVVDGLLLHYRLYEVESGRVLSENTLSGLRSDVFRLFDQLAQDVQRAIGFVSEEEEGEQDFNPVHDSVDFNAFTEYCLARECGLPRNAMDHLERTLRMEPGFRMALVDYLSCCYQVDDLASSLRLLDAYLDAYADDQEILIAAANLCLAFHSVDEGLMYANRAFLNRPGDVEPRVILARFLFAKEMPEEARVHLEAALRSKDETPEASYCLGRYFLDLGDIYQARDYFERCLDADPGYYVALRDLQCCYYELGDFQKGIDACEMLLEADPEDAGSYYNLGLIYQRLGRQRLAMKYFEESVRQDPTFYKAVYMVGEHLYVQEKYTEALQRFEEAHRLAPTSAEALGRVGDCHYQLGRPREALRHYAWARREDPVFESAHYHLIEGQASSEEGRLEEARSHLIKATELNDEIPDAWNELGSVLLRMGRAEEALNVVRRAAELSPAHPAILCNLLTCLSRLPVGVRLSRWARSLGRDTREALRDLRSRNQTPSLEARRRYRRRLRTLTWYGLRG